MTLWDDILRNGDPNYDHKKRLRLYQNRKGPAAPVLQVQSAFEGAGTDATILAGGQSTTTPLGSNATFTGTTDDTTNFSWISIQLYGTVAGATGTLYFEFSPDGTNWDVSVPIAVADLTGFVPFPLIVIARFFRVRYVNGATAQTTFRLQVLYHKQGPNKLTRLLSQTINDSEPVDIGAAIIKAKRTTDSTFVNVPADGNSQLRVTNTPERFSQGYGRVYKTATSGIVTGDTLVYTVTGGKTLYVTSVHVVMSNASTTTRADLAIRDSTSAGAGTIRIDMFAPAGAAGAAAPVIPFPMTFEEPLEFTAGVYLDFTNGTPTGVLVFTGYEE